MIIVAAGLTVFGAVGAAAAALREAPRFLRWYCRATRI
jgi:hypothetical protein